jgi:uncharacterized protein (TIRG00374 family)
LAIAFLIVIFTRLQEIRELFSTLATGQWQWILVAILMQVLYYILYAEIYRSAFRVVGQERKLLELLTVFLASLFVNVAAPSGGATGFALFADDAARRGHSPTRATAGKLLAHVADFSALAIIVFFGLVYLFIVEDLQLYQIVGAAILLALIGVQLGALLLGLWRPAYLRFMLGWSQRIINRVAGWLRRPPVLDDEWARETASEFVEAAAGIAAHPWGLLRTLLIALLAFAVDILSVYMLFLAFRQPIRLGPLVAGFAIGFLFWIVAITPQGIGVVEGVMTLVYNSLGVPAATATIIAITFRGLTFWLPLLVGFVLLRTVKTFCDDERGPPAKGERPCDAP